MKSILFFIMTFMVSTQMDAQDEIQKADRVSRRMYYGKLSTNAFFKKADYIFEATRVSGSRKSFANKDTSEVWTSSLFEITHVFKGGDEIHTGLIELIRDRGILHTADYIPSTHEYLDNPRLQLREKMVLFCKITPDSYQKSDHAFAVAPLENLPDAALYFTEMREYNFKIYGFDHVYFKTVEDFYKFASKKKGITVPEQGADKKKAALRVSSANEFSNPKLDKFMARQQELVDIATKNKAKKANLRRNATNELVLSIKNQKVTGTNTKYFEFDVFARANNSHTYYSNAIARIDFNTAIFGYDLEANGKITLTRGWKFDGATYETNVYDVSESRVNISLNEKSGLSTWNRTKMTTTPIKLFHVKIKTLYKANDGYADINFNEISFTELFSLYSPTAGGDLTTVEFYDYTTYSTPASFLISLNPKIYDFAPTKVKAGTGQVLTINGKNFGATEGKVNFKNANTGGEEYINGIEGYIKNWTDTQIRVKVPSFVKDQETGENVPAGTGDFQVVTSKNKKATSPTPLTVNYSLLNWKIPDSQSDGRYYFVNRSNTNGVEFTLHKNLASNAAAIKCIEKALCAWSSYLGMDLTLKKDAAGNLITTDAPNQPGKNVIWKKYSRAKGMGTKPNASNCAINNKTYHYRKYKTDIEIAPEAAPGANWDYRRSGTVPAGKGSFYNAFLHELGHVLGLDHVVDPDALMHYSIDVSRSQPIVNLFTTGGMPLTAVNRIYNDSQKINWSCSSLTQYSKKEPEITYYAINKGAAQTSHWARYVWLKNSCTVCPTKYKASENPNFSGATWQNYKTNPKFKLSSGSGTKTVYLKVKNNPKVSTVTSDQIRYKPSVSDPENLQNTDTDVELMDDISQENPVISTYPVPCTDKLRIDVPMNILDFYDIKITDIQGNTVYQDQLNTNYKDLELKDLSAGTYVVKLTGSEAVFVKKIIKQ